MSETVFILGAGASVEAGAPAMANFTDVMDQLVKTDDGSSFKSDYELVQRARARLSLAHSKAQLDIDNLEALFGAFEVARVIGRLSGISDDEVKELSPALKRSIYKTLERRVQFPIEGSGQGRYVGLPKPYHEFALLLNDMCKGQDFRNTAVISFNYDLCLDFALHRHGIPFTYELTPGDNTEGLRLLKLHGSMNWGICPGCNKTVPWLLRDFFRTHSYNNLWFSEVKTVILDLASKLGSYKHCGEKGLIEPLLIPPSWNKTEYHPLVAPVWGAAARELSEAENIVICGYSLPETDSFFRHLYALGTISDARVKRFWVINPDKTVETRYQSLLGQAVRSRFSFYDKTFSESVNFVRNQLDVKRINN